MKTLQLALAAQERAQALLSNLERMKEEGALAQSEYSQLKAEYSGAFVQAKTLVESLYRQLDAEMASRRTQSEIYSQQLKNLETRLKVGELDITSYARATHKTQRILRKLEDGISILERLRKASSSVELGASVVSGSTRVGGVRMAGSASARRLNSGGLGGATGSPFEVIGSWNELVEPRAKLIALVGSLLLFVSIFLRWVIVGNEYFIAWQSGTANAGIVAIAAIVFVFCGASTVIAYSRVRGAVQIALGCLAFLVAVGIVFGGGGASFGFDTATIWSGLREGFYLYLASAAAMIVGGVLALRET